MELRCCCCKTVYTRGQFSCCAPPGGMSSHHWLALSCPMPPHGCGQCAKHCQCPNKAERLGKGPLASLAESFIAEAATRRKVVA